MTHRKVDRGTEPLRGLLALMGPPGCGKTFSALRLATGIRDGLQHPRGIALLDTEGRGHLYEGRFRYNRYVLDPPYSPQAWAEAFADLDSRYAVVISDSFSDEHDGIGGLCEMAAASTNPNDVGKWAAPKAQHKQLVNRIRRLEAQHIFLLRAAEKLRIVKGQKDPEYLGWQPTCEKTFLFDVVLAWMLPPNCAGHADVYKSIEGFSFKDGEQLSEEHGHAIARWIRGEAQAEATPKYKVTILRYDGSEYKVADGFAAATAAYREVKELAKGHSDWAVQRARELNRDALLVLAEMAPGPRARASLQAEIDAVTEGVTDG